MSSNRETIEDLRARDPRVLFNRTQAAAFFGRSISWFSKVMKDENLPCIRVGRSPMFTKDVLYDHLLRMNERIKARVVLFMVR